MSDRQGATGRGNTLFGAAALVMAMCCAVGPAVIGALAGSALGGVAGVALAVAVAGTGAFALHRWRRGRRSAC